MQASSNGAVFGGPRIILRFEGAAILCATMLLYVWMDYNWWVFGAFFLLPDVGLLAYYVSNKAGAVAYNATHTYTIPLLVSAASLFLPENPLIDQVVLIWIAHIGFDRMLGYGLKYATAFGDTHLGILKRKA